MLAKPSCYCFTRDSYVWRRYHGDNWGHSLNAHIVKLTVLLSARKKASRCTQHQTFLPWSLFVHNRLWHTVGDRQDIEDCISSLYAPSKGTLVYMFIHCMSVYIYYMQYVVDGLPTIKVYICQMYAQIHLCRRSLPRFGGTDTSRPQRILAMFRMVHKQYKLYLKAQPATWNIYSCEA